MRRPSARTDRVTSLAFAAAPVRLRAVSAILALALLGGCSYFRASSQPRGHKVDDDLVKELVPGTSTRADVTALLGSPTARATFDDSTWLYLASVTRPQIARMPAVDSQQVTLVRFNEAGVLQEIRQMNKDDSVPVDVVSRETPTPGNEMTFLQEFLGNVGRLNPGAPSK